MVKKYHSRALRLLVLQRSLLHYHLLSLQLVKHGLVHDGQITVTIGGEAKGNPRVQLLLTVKKLLVVKLIGPKILKQS